MKRHRVLAPLLLFAAVVAARALLVAAYASPTPYWDQWAAEGARLLDPWLAGELALGDLFTAHNEHRVLWTRLLTLALFEANGRQWDNLVAALFNTLPAGALFAGLYAALRGGLASRGARVALFAVLLVLGILPFGWENLLVGFQSQFHLLALAAFGVLCLAARAPGRAASLPALWALAIASLFTMASGMLAAVVAAGLLAARAWLRDIPGRVAAAGIGGLGAIALAGAIAVPRLAKSAARHPQDAGEWTAALGALFGWPAGGWPAAAILWLPAAWAATRVWRRRSADAPTLLALGLAAWALGQAAAIAYARGHALTAPSARYTDLLVLGLVANAWFAIRAADDWRRTRGDAGAPTAGRFASAAAIAVLALAPLLAVGTLVHDARDAPAHLRSEARLGRIQSGNVRAYLVDGDPRRLRAPWREIPFPSASLLRTRLDLPTLRGALPWNLVDPRPDGGLRAGPLSAAAAALQRVVQRALLDDDIGLPQDERAASVRVAEGPPEALWLGDGAQLSARFRSPQSGRLQRLGLRVATGRRVLAGMLRLQVCTDHCVTATASLGGARDGGDLLFAFAEPLELAAGRPVQVELEAAVQGPPVALWLHPADPGAAPLRVRDSQGERQVPARSPRFTLGLRR